jgi:c-di-GMP-binding flagellar brake protein YcgR
MIIPERRRAERVRVNLDVIFADRERQHKGTISDISVTGCFILSSVEATPGEPITVIINLPNNRTIKLAGEVVYNTAEIGFAMRFVELPDGVLRFIQKLIERFRPPQSQPEQAAEQ